VGTDRYITWGETPEWGAPTPEKLAAVAIDFLGDRWTAKVREDTGCLVVQSPDYNTFHLASERPEMKNMYKPTRSATEPTTRGFEVWFDSPEITRVTTRGHSCDAFTSCLAEEYIRIIARWWNGEVEWPS